MRCSQSNHYHRRKQTQSPKFKFWMRMFGFTLVRIQLFSPSSYRGKEKKLPCVISCLCRKYKQIFLVASAVLLPSLNLRSFQIRLCYKFIVVSLQLVSLKTKFNHVGPKERNSKFVASILHFCTIAPIGNHKNQVQL